jgi:hypothetical protein
LVVGSVQGLIIDNHCSGKGGSEVDSILIAVIQMCKGWFVVGAIVLMIALAVYSGIKVRQWRREAVEEFGDRLGKRILVEWGRCASKAERFAKWVRAGAADLTLDTADDVPYSARSFFAPPEEGPKD